MVLRRLKVPECLEGSEAQSAQKAQRLRVLRRLRVSECLEGSESQGAQSAQSVRIRSAGCLECSKRLIVFRVLRVFRFQAQGAQSAQRAQSLNDGLY